MRLSIVMPCLNRAGFIREALDSIFSQEIDDIEVIVADGGSTDGTLDILHEYENVHVIVEKDEGLYDALNKAIYKSSGDIIGHLNTDDVYLPDSLEKIMAEFRQSPTLEMICGNAEVAVLNSKGEWQRNESFSSADYGNLTWDITLKGPILTNARFYRRELVMRSMPFNINYKIISDRDFLIRIMKQAPETLPLDIPVLQYRCHEGSLTFTEDFRALWRGSLEKMKLSRELFLKSTNEEKEIYASWGKYEALEAVYLSLEFRSPGSFFTAVCYGGKYSLRWLAILPYVIMLRVWANLRRI